MMTFVMVTRLAPEHTDPIDVAQIMKERSGGADSWRSEIKSKCPEVKFLAHYALLGSYDFMDIYEAPSEETAALVSIITRANGAFQVESWPAIPSTRFAEIVLGR
ncbi:MAG: GYD domain-containing protein [Candidatus Zixiibacteriota bacterium]